jgi:hypothetical protein
MGYGNEWVFSQKLRIFPVRETYQIHSQWYFALHFQSPIPHKKIFYSCTRADVPLPPCRSNESPNTIYLITFMSYRDDEAYDKDHEFTPEELNEIQPEEIEKWTCVMVYGIPEPGPDDNPTLGRSSSLEYYKKALSYYMPNRLI